ncbi:hypothetical protein [Paraburkholderia caballeronis]|uniref:Glycine zipper n=1 Tax=Paraburkholderia caballeronis TaxID=416943 RepID=A0A1H7J1U8_9BURK|nr:hypothetical protein [Paraburkholderia caballeronis]PXW27594.1 hypothetical protein C7403_103508 [Paraburkholderia caballeronis]PXX03068.1 hypothetical protein C7407_103508 [Paraburkholderia caballeronis]RAK03793.1 hypothetical protein C7409_103508 [Paraburkholderia caballeronis]TDV21034.1 hypothetical protein C7408_101553 [Paraburkholderia caballeronis]TDV21463.1 hypothetical protein C7406_102363 [Paraburkholderia caballeronis]
MSLIVAGRFTTFDDAETAIGRLRSNGFVDEDISLFYVNPGGQHARFPVGGDRYADPQARTASLGAGAGVAAGALIGIVVALALSYFLFHTLLVLAIAAGIGAYVGSLAGAMWQTRGGGHRPTPDAAHEPDGTPRTRESGVLLAVHVSPQTQQRAAELLRDAGGMEVERASGRWQDGRWADFDPTRTLQPVGRMNG